MNLDLKSLTTQLREACGEAKNFILDNRYKVNAGDIEHKSLNSLVSFVDKGAEEILVRRLREILPEAGFIAEEGTAGSSQGLRYNWVIDPLDGTTNFLHGLPVFAISVGLLDGEEVVSGLVWELGRDECFTAWRGGGAFLNDEPIRVSDNADFSQSLIATGFPYYDFGKMENFLALLGDIMGSTRGVRRLGSAATDLAYVACGRFDSFFEYGLSPWDVAAGVILVQEAGGEVMDFRDGDNYIHGGEINAGSKPIVRELQQRIKKWF